jgi:hypothetical protein
MRVFLRDVRKCTAAGDCENQVVHWFASSDQYVVVDNLPEHIQPTRTHSRIFIFAFVT